MIPNTFDSIFDAHASKEVPAAFLKSLAWHESKFNPEAKPPKSAGSSALGLFQLLKSTVAEFAKATGKPYKHPQMVRPTQATEVGAWLVRQTVHRLDKYAKLPANWKDPTYVGLVALAHTAGNSVVQGVPHLVTLTRKAGQQVTVANVVAMAQKSFPKSTIYDTGNGYMSDPALHRHVERITSDYFALAGLPIPRPTPQPVRKEAPNVAKATQKGTKDPQPKVQVFAKPGTPGAIAKAPVRPSVAPKKVKRPGLMTKILGRRGAKVVNRGASAVKKGAAPVLKSPIAKAAGSAALDMVPGGGLVKNSVKAVNVVKQAQNVKQNARKARNTLARANTPMPQVQARQGMQAKQMANRPKQPMQGPKKSNPIQVTPDEFKGYIAALDKRVMALYSALPSIQAASADAQAYKKGAENYVANWISFRKKAVEESITQATVGTYNAFQKGYDTLLREGKLFLDKAETAAAWGMLYLGVGAAAATILLLQRRK